MPRPTVAIADLHGHRTLFDRLVAWFDEEVGGYDLVTLGDYADNGPEVPALLDRLVELEATRSERFFPILGNHDLGLLRAIGWAGDLPNPLWFSRLKSHYWNRGLGTADAYGARDAADLARRMPAAHRAFLQRLPWYREFRGHVFVHAGLEAGALRPQLEALAERKPLPGVWQHKQLREKKLSTVSDPAWGKVVVSGHTKRPGLRVPGHPNAPHFADRWRICLSAEVDETGELFAVLLPERRVFSVRAGEAVREVAPLR